MDETRHIDIQYSAKAKAIHLIEDRAWALEHARAGDWDVLADYLQRGGLITREVRLFLCEVLWGAETRPRRKLSKLSTEQFRIDVATFILDEKLTRKITLTEAVKLAAKKFGRDRRQILRYWKEKKEIAPHALAAYETSEDPRVSAFAEEAWRLFDFKTGMPRYVGVYSTPEHFMTDV
jgi:hypothetical protein